MTIETPVEEELPGIITEIADLKPGAIITEEGMAKIFHRDPTTIKRMVQRGELPPPIRMAGSPVWTAGVIARHIEARLEEARKEKEGMAKHSPPKHSLT